MCFNSGRRAPDPNAATIEAEQAKQKVAAEEAKAAAEATALEQQKIAIETAQAEAVSVYKAEQEAKRQVELDKEVETQALLAKEAADKKVLDDEAAAAAADVAAKLSKEEQAAAAQERKEEREATMALIASLEENQKSLIKMQQTYMTKQTEEAEAEKEVGPVLSTAAERQKRISKFGSIATRGRASRRSGSRSRRSLITGLGGGIGYYDRFAN